jgi:asparagine synthase (glutamine-hydrolysing)
MPGITGIIGRKPRSENRAELEAMVASMTHEPFYTSGTLANERLGLWVGWTGFEGSFSDCMPVWNENKDVCLVFAGEEFTDAEQITTLRARGHLFDPENASYLVHLYEEKGPGFLERLNGWFSGVVMDLRQNRIYLFNDRYGINRIYHHQNANGFYFASEAKALLKVLPETRSVDHASLGEFFSCGCVLQNRSVFSGVSLVPGGSVWSFSPGEPARKEVYFKKELWEEQPQLSGPEYFEKLQATWTRILPRYFRGKRGVGLSLTGGLDSRMILACAPCAPETLPCYTFGGMYRDCADVTISRQIAHACRQKHETIPLDREFLRMFPGLMERNVYLTDGALDATGAADLFVQKRAREIAPVRITGLNGGELLRRLTMFKPWAPNPELLAPDFAQRVQAATGTYAGERQDHLLSFIVFKQAPWHLQSRLALERSQITIRTPYFDNDLVALAYQAPPEMINYEPALRLIAAGTPALKDIGTDRARVLKSVPAITKIQHAFQEFTFKAEYAYDYGMPPWLAKINYLTSPLRMERLFLGRHKFYHFRVWFRDEISQYLKDVLLDPRSRARPYLNGAFLEHMVKSHTSGRGNYTSEIQRVLTAELLQRQLIEQQ